MTLENEISAPNDLTPVKSGTRTLEALRRAERALENALADRYRYGIDNETIRKLEEAVRRCERMLATRSDQL